MPVANYLGTNAPKPARALIKKDAMAQIARVIKGRFIESALARTAHEEERVKDYRRADPQWINSQTIKSPPLLKPPYMHQALRKKTGWLYEQVSQDTSWRTAISQTPDHERYGEPVSAWLHHNLSLPAHDFKRGNDVQISRGLHMGLKYGVNWWNCTWEEDEDFWGVRYNIIPWEDVYPDWKEGRWYITRSYLPLYRVGEMAAALTQIPVFDPISGTEVKNSAERIAENFAFLKKTVEEGSTSTDRFDHWYSVDANRHQRDAGKVSDDDEYGDSFWVASKDDPMNVRVPVLEYHQRRRHGMVIKVIPAPNTFGEDLLFQSAPAPYKYCQLVPFIPFPVDQEEWGYSLPYVTGHLDEVLGYALRAQIRFLSRVADPAILFKSGTKLKRQSHEVLTNRPIEVQDTSDVKFMDAPSQPGLHQILYQMVKGVADEGIAESEQRRGIPGKGTATGQNIARTNAGIDDGLIAHCAKQTLTHMMRVSLEIMRVHLTEEKAFAIAGVEGGHKLLAMKPEYMNASYAFHLSGQMTAQDPAMKAAALTTAWQTFGPAGIMDPEKTYLKFAHLAGIDNPREILMSGPQIQPKEPDAEHIAMLKFGELPRPSPRENLQQHLMEHSAFQMQLQQQLPPEHPVFMLLQNHLTLTSMLMEQQQMQMPQPQGGQGTPPGIQDATRAGGPGQIQQPGAEAMQVQQMRQQGGNPATNPAMPPFAPGRASAVA